MRNNISSNLTKRLNFLENKTFEEWCELTVDTLSLSKIPVVLNDYFAQRRISEVVVDTNISFPAQIKKNNNSFIILLNNNINWNESNIYRYYIAHEIAHTFLFEFNGDLILDRTYLLPGSSEVEFFCNRLARTILLPQKLLYPFFQYFKNSRDNFSLKLFNDLCIAFKIENKYVLQRIINDLDFLGNLVLFRFIKFHNQQSWKLLSRYLSNKYTFDKKYFIPRIDQNKSKEFVKRFPSCGTKLNQFLNDLDNSLLLGEEKKTELFSELINDKPISWFMRNFNNYSFDHSVISKVKSKNNLIINLMIFLND